MPAWLQSFFGVDALLQPQQEAARRIQAAQRARQQTCRVASPPPADGALHHDASRPHKMVQHQRSALLASLRGVHASCDVVAGGASCSELLERIAATPSLLQALDDFRPGNAAALLHALVLPAWVESDGRVTLPELHRAAHLQADDGAGVFSSTRLSA